MLKRTPLVYMVSRMALICERYAAGCTKTGTKILQVKRGQKQRNAPGKAQKGRNRVRFGCWKEKDGEILYRKYEETHYQKAYSLERTKELLLEAGMEYIAAYDAFTREPARKDSERIYILAREKGKNSQKEEI